MQLSLVCFQWRGKPLKGTIAKVLTWRWVNTDTEQDELDHTSSPRKRVRRVTVRVRASCETVTVRGVVNFHDCSVC